MSAWRAMQTVLWWIVCGMGVCFAGVLLIAGTLAWLLGDDDSERVNDNDADLPW
jgi:hypothetical protein